MKFQDVFLIALFTFSLLFFGCNGDDDSPPTQPGATCDLVCLNGGLINVDSCLCACLPGYSGDSCQNVNMVCELECLNGGVLDFDSCLCDCPQGFSGDSCEVEPTKTELLISKNWMVEGLTVEPAIDIDNNGTQENNLIPFLAACNLDDFYDFNADGSYTVEEGVSKCDPNDPSIIQSGNWLWNSDETRIIIEPFGQGAPTSELEIISISFTEVVLSSTQVSQGVTYTYTQTWN